MVVKQSSLDNLKKPKEKKQGHGHRYAVPAEKVDALFACIADGDSLKLASQKVNVSYTTAKKYFEKGDENRGIVPLKKRLMIFQEQISEKLNALAEESRMNRLKFVNQAIAQMEDKMLGKKTVVKDDGTHEVVQGELPPFKITDYERMVKLQFFLQGGVKEQKVERKLLTAEEIIGG